MVSYCRWSSMDWACDVYVYEDVHGGWTIHVAGRRRDFKKAGIELPEPVPFDTDHVTEWIERHGTVMDMLDSDCWDDDDFVGWVDVPGPHAGESYNLSSPGECADMLETIRGSGCIVPQYAIDALREEQIEIDAEEEKSGSGSGQRADHGDADVDRGTGAAGGTEDAR